MTQTRRELFVVALAGAAAACGAPDTSERYLILNTEPFFSTDLDYDPTRIDAVIDAVRSFSDSHHMDFLLARHSLPRGDFNTSANGPTLNLKAMHIGQLYQGVKIYAIARGEPTLAHRAQVDAFVAAVRASAMMPGNSEQVQP